MLMRNIRHDLIERISLLRARGLFNEAAIYAGALAAEEQRIAEEIRHEEEIALSRSRHKRLIEHVVDILREAHAPLRFDELKDRLAKRGWISSKHNANLLSSKLSRSKMVERHDGLWRLVPSDSEAAPSAAASQRPEH
ncbi:hypothetical protein [Inquilinus sp.]|jgi:hypothetical protein|uniref:hypothetical protein n=1 Tax=Inquilinus sp. TaxID=1932117 RepID=UPI00378446D0